MHVGRVHGEVAAARRVPHRPGDDVALAAAVQELLADEARRLELAAAAQARALERYGPDRLGREYEAVYLEATGS